MCIDAHSIYRSCSRPNFTTTLNFPNVSRSEWPLHREYLCSKHGDTRTNLRNKLTKNSSMTDTSVGLVTLVINNTVVHLVLIMHGTGTSFHYRLLSNITVSHLTSAACTKACKTTAPANPAWAKFRTTCPINA